jgi:hypothetical protein
VFAPTEDPAVAGGVAQTFLDRGVLGACVLVLAALAWWLIRREASRADEAQRQVTALHDSIRTDVVVALVKANDVLAKVAEILPDVASALRDHDRDHDGNRDRGRR